MKDSFLSILGISFVNYVINIRGLKCSYAVDFLKLYLNDNATISSYEDPRGWATQSLELSKNIIGDHVFFWVEDHIFISNQANFFSCLQDAISSNYDLLYYSFITPAVTSQYYKNLSCVSYCNVDSFVLSNESMMKLKWIDRMQIYTSSMVTVVPKKRFKNRLIAISKNECLRWPHETPFNFEQTWNFEKKNKIVVTIPRLELFASIDDDLDPGYSLISRGKYPDRIKRNNLRTAEGMTSTWKIIIRNHLLSRGYVIPSIIFNYLKTVYYTLRYYSKLSIYNLKNR